MELEVRFTIFSLVMALLAMRLGASSSAGLAATREAATAGRSLTSWTGLWQV